MPARNGFRRIANGFWTFPQVTGDVTKCHRLSPISALQWRPRSRRWPQAGLYPAWPYGAVAKGPCCLRPEAGEGRLVIAAGGLRDARLAGPEASRGMELEAGEASKVASQPTLPKGSR